MYFPGIILFGHSNMDRIFGCGLKYADSFRHTHLGMLGSTNGAASSPGWLMRNTMLPSSTISNLSLKNIILRYALGILSVAFLSGSARLAKGRLPVNSLLMLAVLPCTMGFTAGLPVMACIKPVTISAIWLLLLFVTGPA